MRVERNNWRRKRRSVLKAILGGSREREVGVRIEDRYKEGKNREERKVDIKRWNSGRGKRVKEEKGKIWKRLKKVTNDKDW